MDDRNALIPDVLLATRAGSRSGSNSSKRILNRLAGVPTSRGRASRNASGATSRPQQPYASMESIRTRMWALARATEAGSSRARWRASCAQRPAAAARSSTGCCRVSCSSGHM